LLKEIGMSDNNSLQQGPPKPDPALTRLERFVGTWTMRGRTLGAEEDDVFGQTTFEWLPGGFFLQQRFQANFMGMEIHSLELIGYDPASQRFPSSVYSNLWGSAIPYEWDVQGDSLRISMDGAKFNGRFSEDGNSFSGGWRPDPGREGPGNVAYDIAGTRVT
jgi:uncharacterized protein DUF1579